MRSGVSLLFGASPNKHNTLSCPFSARRQLRLLSGERVLLLRFQALLSFDNGLQHQQWLLSSREFLRASSRDNVLLQGTDSVFCLRLNRQ